MREKQRTRGLNLITAQTKQREKQKPGRQPLLDGNERVERMYEEGWTDIEIATAMNCNKATVQRWRVKTGRPSNGKKGRPRKEKEKTDERSNDHQAQM